MATAAVKAYKSASGKSPNGKVDQGTWEDIKEKYNNVIETGIISDKGSLGPNVSSGSGSNYVKDKVKTANASSKNSKDCGGIDAISSAAMGTGDFNKTYTWEEANKYIYEKIWGVIVARKTYSSNEISNLPEEITYKKDGYIYSYMLQEQNEYFMGATLRTNITIDGKNLDIKKYAYDLVYTDDKVLTGTIYIGGLGAKGNGNLKTRLPRTEGYWEGQPGSGKWFSYKNEVNNITGNKPVEFTNGRPNFTPWSKGSLKFKEGQLNGTQEDFDLVYEKIKNTKGLSSKNQAKEWLSKKGLTPHHKSNTEIELIPTDLHKNVPHIGSASDLRGGN